MAWPRLQSGDLDLSDRTFREMSKIYHKVAPLREFRAALSKMRLNSLEVGADGRSRCLLSPFQARSSRNLPSNSRFIFGPSVWIRGLIKPPQGYGVAYVDWEQQEFGIAAALSGDPAMMAAYASGDPYLEFAKQTGTVPPDATKKSHPAEREQFKQCALGIQYGMAAYSLASRIGKQPIVARRLLELHRETYPKFWKWSDGAVTLNNILYTVFRWYVHVGPDVNPRSY
jgi:DNA polymerase family A